MNFHKTHLRHIKRNQQRPPSGSVALLYWPFGSMQDHQPEIPWIWYLHRFQVIPGFALLSLLSADLSPGAPTRFLMMSFIPVNAPLKMNRTSAPGSNSHGSMPKRTASLFGTKRHMEPLKSNKLQTELLSSSYSDGFHEFHQWQDPGPRTNFVEMDSSWPPPNLSTGKTTGIPPSFTRKSSKHVWPSNHPSKIFWILQLTCGKTSELRPCAAQRHAGEAGLHTILRTHLSVLHDLQKVASRGMWQCGHGFFSPICRWR